MIVRAVEVQVIRVTVEHGKLRVGRKAAEPLKDVEAMIIIVEGIVLDPQVPGRSGCCSTTLTQSSDCYTMVFR